MKTSEVLKAARPLIQSCEFLCLAVDNVAGREDAARVRSMIEKRLDGSYTLNSWLGLHHNIGFTPSNNYSARMHTTRLAWVDSMIEEFEAIGD